MTKYRIKRCWCYFYNEPQWKIQKRYFGFLWITKDVTWFGLNHAEWLLTKYRTLKEKNEYNYYK